MVEVVLWDRNGRRAETQDRVGAVGTVAVMAPRRSWCCGSSMRR